MAASIQTIVVGKWSENCYVVSDRNNGCVVIDPGDDAGLIAQTIRDAGLRPLAILATHGHHDHIGAAAELRSKYRVPMLLHAADRRVLKHANFYRRALHRASRIEIPDVDRWLEDESELCFGGIGFKLLRTPGHTRGGITLVHPDGAFTGDTLMKGAVGRVDLPGGDQAVLCASLRLLAALPAATVLYPGHGAATDVATELSTNESLKELLGARAY